MEKNYSIRPLRAEDFATLIEWWQYYDHMEVPDSGLLPNGGLGGFIVEKDGKRISAAFLYLTNSDIGYVDYLVSDPHYKNRDRYEMITDLIAACSQEALLSGCRMTWAMTSFKGVVKRCDDLGYEVLDDNYKVIYTHQKAYKDIVKQNKN